MRTRLASTSHRRAHRRPACLARLGLLLPAVLASAVAGQSTPPASPPPLAGLETVPLSVDAFGLSWRVPAGAVVRPESIGERLTIVVEDRNPPPAWSIRVMTMNSTLPDPTPAGQIQDHIRRLTDASDPFEILSNQPIQCGGLVGQLCYLRHVGADGRALIRGWLILPRTERSFLVFALVTLPGPFVDLEGLLARSFATITLDSPDDVATRRNRQLARGGGFTESLSPQRLRELCGYSRWSRIYRPAGPTTGAADQEIGYSYVDVFAGKRGLLNPDKPESRYSAAEHEEGLVVRIRGRLIGDAARGIYFDSDAIYWLSWDQTEEAWSIRGTQRQGDATRSESETGLRTPPSTGNPRARLTVIRSRTATNQRDPYEWSVPGIYLSQALGSTVGRLLPRAGNEPLELSYYYYNSRGDDPRLTIRTDHWAPAPDTSGDWILTTRLGAEGETYRTVYGADGEIKHITLRDGSISQPVDLEDLRQLWGRRGLRIDRPR
ncbi:MAG: hypothetical protein ACYTGG_02100 [Planctomycetota bacterium]|jgi:hypothetical protein